jgi:long-chain acyl-CoA synthetase
LLGRPFVSYGELIRLHARQRPDHPALIEGERRVSFATLDAMMDRVAATLQRKRIRATEAIAICAGSSLEYVAVFLGALRAGVAVAPLAPHRRHRPSPTWRPMPRRAGSSWMPLSRPNWRR